MMRHFCMTWSMVAILANAAPLDTGSLTLPIPFHPNSTATNAVQGSLKDIGFFDFLDLGYKQLADRHPNMDPTHQMGIELTQKSDTIIDFQNLPITMITISIWEPSNDPHLGIRVRYESAWDWGSWPTDSSYLTSGSVADGFDYTKVKASGLDLGAAWQAILDDPQVQATGFGAATLKYVHLSLVLDKNDGKHWYKFIGTTTKTYLLPWVIWIDLGKNVKIVQRQGSSTLLKSNGTAVL